MRAREAIEQEHNRLLLPNLKPSPRRGGGFTGAHISGTVMPGGADWVILRSDGVMEIDVRITLETHSGALIYLAYTVFSCGANDAMEP